MEVHQVQMESVVRGIQADMTKLSKSHSHTANTVSKLLDKSKKLSVTMKEVRAQMEKQGAQVKKLEANHAHLIDRNQFRVLIFQEQTEIPASVFVKDQPPFPRDDITEEGEEPQPEGAGLHTIDLSSDEEAGLEAELDDDWPQDLELENLEPTRAEKLKRSSLKKVDSLKKAFSKQNIEKKMTKIGTKLVSVEQRQKLKLKSPVSFGLKKSRGSAEIQVETLEAVAETMDSPDALPQDDAPSVGHEEQEAPVELDQSLDQSQDQSQDQSLDQSQDQESAEGMSADYALSSTLPQDQEPDQGPDQSSDQDPDQDPDQSPKIDLEKDLEEEPEKKLEPEENVQGGARGEWEE
ncbi:caveolae-associated protein 2-like isoform X2 [Periophthalmus magnuspinnatus]|nr:caveolae-associated protein 2-like isoform X2 [Periophthalmus magnuspinnatus]